MKRRYLIPISAIAFGIGTIAMPAYADVRAESKYVTVAGGSASCTLVAASTNATTEKSGAKTINRQGCNSGNAGASMAAGRLKAEAYVVLASVVTTTCSYYHPKVNSTSDTAVTATAVIEKAGCSVPNFYGGLAVGGRKTLDGIWTYDQAEVKAIFWPQS